MPHTPIAAGNATTCLDCQVLPPFSIRLCALHAAAPEMLALLGDLQEAMTTWADDVEEAGYPQRAEALRWQADRTRALLARLGG